MVDLAADDERLLVVLDRLLVLPERLVGDAEAAQQRVFYLPSETRVADGPPARTALLVLPKIQRSLSKGENECVLQDPRCKDRQCRFICFGQQHKKKREREEKRGCF